MSAISTTATFSPSGRGVQRGAVAAGAATDDDEIEFGCGLHVGSVGVGQWPSMCADA